jgi:hypothetical protein
MKQACSSKFVFTLIFLCCTIAIAGSDPEAQLLTPLRARGFSLIPAPQEAELGTLDVVIDGSWTIEPKIATDDIAFNRLISGASDLHNLSFGKKGKKKIVLAVVPGTVKGAEDPALNEQGYLLRVTPAAVEITGNSNTGLFYGVQSLLQLLRRNASGSLILPECVIRDWPDMQLRFVHWDTKHHQKRIETMKRLIDWHAFFKVNMIALEIEDKYEYPSHPVIGAPGAYKKEEIQDLTRYALERHIQIVPDVQAPAHMAYVLKHKEFAHLKADTASNYQACMCDPEAISLIFDMYQDMIDATPGVDYFLVSTDEIYYAGICDKCKRPYNPENRSLAWAEYAVNAHEWLAKKGRKMISWVEYPLLAGDIALLPPDIINGVMGNDRTFIEMQKKIGMRQLAYSSIQGSEKLFSNYFSENYMGISNTVRDGIALGANPVGSFAAAWDDSGLHEEVFHLGWATVTQYAWNMNGPAMEQTVADFMDVFYGQQSPDMVPVYKLLIEGAQFFGGGWDQITSREREPGWGNSRGRGFGTRKTDELLTMPEIPQEKTLAISYRFTASHGDLIIRAEGMKVKNDELVSRLTGYIGKVERNRYNIEVYLSIAYLERYFINTVLTLRDAESLMLNAQSAAAEGKPVDAVANLVEASNLVGELNTWGSRMWDNLTLTWEKSRYEKGRSVSGRNFVHVFDDVKDHWADRRKGLDYMIAPFERMNLPEWRARLNDLIRSYAAENRVPVTGLEEARLED